MDSKTVVFVHGMFMTPRCWDGWLTKFEGRGYKVHAPAWPHHDQDAASLRQQHPHAPLGELNLSKVIAHLSTFIGQLGHKPIVVGHSMGGLIAQILLQRDLIGAAVAIDSAPPAGVITTRWSFLKSNWTMLNPFIPASKPHLMSFEAFQYAFVNDMPLAEQRAAYDQHLVPESRRIARETLGGIAKLDWNKPHAPLLLIAGGNDHIIPPTLNQTNYRKYRAAGSITDFKEFAGRNHFTIGQRGWEEVAGYALGWLEIKAV